MRIVVLTPYFGGIDHEHYQCARALLATPVNRAEVIAVELPACPWIDMAFAYLVDKGIEHRPDVLLFVEHDMIFEAHEAVDMCWRLLSSDYDVLGACYSQRRAGGRIVGEFPPHVGEVCFYKPGLVDATVLGLGFTAMRPEVIFNLRETMAPVYCPAVDAPIHPYFAHEISTAGYLGQDTSFMRRVKATGARLGADLEPRVFHKGAYRYAIEDTGITVPRYGDGLTVHLDRS